MHAKDRNDYLVTYEYIITHIKFVELLNLSCKKRTAILYKNSKWNCLVKLNFTKWTDYDMGSKTQSPTYFWCPKKICDRILKTAISLNRLQFSKYRSIVNTTISTTFIYIIYVHSYNLNNTTIPFYLIKLRKLRRGCICFVYIT